jgi:hypothetical protein
MQAFDQWKQGLRLTSFRVCFIDSAKVMYSRIFAVVAVDLRPYRTKVVGINFVCIC